MNSLTYHKDFTVEGNSTAAVFRVLHRAQLRPLVCVRIVLQKGVTQAVRLIVQPA